MENPMLHLAIIDAPVVESLQSKSYDLRHVATSNATSTMMLKICWTPTMVAVGGSAV